MGLDTSYGCWNGSYSGFTIFREALCDVEGIDLDELWKREFKENNFMGVWKPDEEPEDALLYLIVHSDCEGYIAHRHQIPLAERLEEVAAKIPDADVAAAFTWGRYNWKASAIQFAKGLREAHEAGDILEFF